MTPVASRIVNDVSSVRRITDESIFFRGRRSIC